VAIRKLELYCLASTDSEGVLLKVQEENKQPVSKIAVRWKWREEIGGLLRSAGDS